MALTILEDNILIIDQAYVQADFPFRAPNGTVSSPGYSFTNGTSTGFYRYAANSIGTSCGGSVRSIIDTVKQQLNVPLAIREQAAAPTAIGTYGYLWVKNTTPCELWFTDDAGTSTKIV
jgi:hypothetical protein